MALDRDLEETIDECQVQQDDSSFLVSLLARYEVETGEKDHKSIKKVKADFKFADRVIVNEAKRIRHAISVPPSELNSDQYSFVETALSHDISYLWGPPGTGKTKCLGTIIAGFYEVKERSAIVSNTNQAVDQVLLKLCRDLEANGRKKDLEDGRIIRLGLLQNEELKAEFGHYIDIDRIVETKGIEHERTAVRLRKQLKADIDELNALNEILSFMDDLEGLVKEAEFRRRCFIRAEQKYENESSRLKKNKAKQKALIQERGLIGNRGFLKEVFGKSKSQINQLLVQLEETEHKLNLTNQTASQEYKKNKELMDKAVKDLNKAEKATRNMSREEVIDELQFIGDRKDKSESELSKVNQELESLKKNIIKEALVVGSTLTKVFLSPAQVGKCKNLIIDEASMAFLPELYFAASQTEKRVIISGDFRQLPPIIKSDNATIMRSIGQNVFMKSGVGPQLFDGNEIINARMLQWQYRMPEWLCNQISEFAYNSKLRNAPGITFEKKPAPEGYDAPLIVVDTSEARPYCDIDISGSRSNTMHAVIAKRLIKEFSSNEHYGSIGYCTPFRSQSNLLKFMLKVEGLDQRVSAGTIHVLQGDEKDTIILDTVDACGPQNAGMHISQDNADKSQLMTVAMSRAKQRMIIIANLEELDRKLPARAFLRKVLSEAEKAGSIIKADEVIKVKDAGQTVRKELLKRNEELKKIKDNYRAKNAALKKAEKDLQLMKKAAEKDIEGRSSDLANMEKSLAEKSEESARVERELTNKKEDIRKRESDLRLIEANLNDCIIKEDEFDALFSFDVGKAKKSLVIYSAFITPQRVEYLSRVFEDAKRRGIAMRAVVPPPIRGMNGSISIKDTQKAISLLKETGFVVDMRARIHEKAVMIDDHILLTGSPNPLSFSNINSETIIRLVQPGICLQFAQKNSAHGSFGIEDLNSLL